MAKNEIPQNWNGQSVLSGDHIPELETDAYMAEAQGLPRDVAAQQVYQQYKRKHHIQAAAMHYKGMKAAQSMGNPQEAQKHMLTYGLHVQSLGLDPYGATSPEILAASQDPNLAIPYKFTAHPADAFLLQNGGAAQPQPQGGNMMTKHEIGHELYKVLKKATEVLEGADQPAPRTGPSPFEKLEQDAQKAGKPVQENSPGSANPSASPKERKCGSCGASVPFSTTLEGDDNAMGAPSSIPGAKGFSTTLEGQDGQTNGGSIPNVPFSTTLEGNDAGLQKGVMDLTRRAVAGVALAGALAAAPAAQAAEPRFPDANLGVKRDIALPTQGAQNSLPVYRGETAKVAPAATATKLPHAPMTQNPAQPKVAMVQKGELNPGEVFKCESCLAKEEFKPTNAFAIKLGYAKKHEILHGIYSVATEVLAKHDEKHNIKISRAMGGQRFIDEQGNMYNTLGEAAERLGLQASHIDEVLHGQRDQANGHTFKYLDN